MALSYQNGMIPAYKVFNALKLERIISYPTDYYSIDNIEKEYPIEQQPYGIDCKSDMGWENLFFFVKNPSAEFVEQWRKLKDLVPNSSFEKKYKENPEYTMFGWF